jgi:sucrose-6-phosphate hydrolase SacC (GH32 family)
MNDPNGLVHTQGTWHLAYQHHPHDLSWGPMHWGHATSTDLLTWRHDPVALRPDHLGAAFSGSAVVDRDGDAGFGAGALVAFFTHFEEGVPQSQGVAVSLDGGTRWQPYAGNPVLRAPEGLVDFRDPKVFRHGDHWVMVLAAGHEVALFTSTDLLHWAPASRFGRERGAHDGVWETPDLVELEVPGTGERHWVLVVSVMSGGPAGGSGTQWLRGSFDGTTFVPEDGPDLVRWVDHGGDFYAPQSWSGAPDGRRVWVAWMSNWAYGRTTPAAGWRGAMTLPRELSLRERADGALLAQRPVPELDGRGRLVVDREEVPLTGRWPVDAGEAFDLRLEVPEDRSVVLELLDGAARVAWRDGALRFERGVHGLQGADAAPQVVPVATQDGRLDLRVVVDTCSVELFADEGTVVLTNQVFPLRPVRSPLVLVAEAPVTLRRLTLRDLSRTA